MKNEEVCAYVKVAAKNTGIKFENIDQLIDEMTYLMDLYTGSEIITKAFKIGSEKNDEA